MSDKHDEMHDEPVAAESNEAETPATEAKASAEKEEEIAHTSSEARAELRAAMQGDVEAFLASGGQIQKIDDNVMADPPRKPQSNYGSRPI